MCITMLPPGQKLTDRVVLSVVHLIHAAVHVSAGTHRYKVTQLGADAIHPEELTIDSVRLPQQPLLPVVLYQNRFLSIFFV